MQFDVLIVGAGASGLSSSVTFENKNLKIGLIDSNERIGKKLISTGNGRCNISNSSIPRNEEKKLYYHGDKSFIDDVISNFNVNKLYNFFGNIGLPLIELENNKLFPMSLQASSVIDIFLMELSERNIEMFLGFKVYDIKWENDLFKVYTKSKEKSITLKCKNLILAGGGMSVPSTGSDGSCYKFAKSFGHSIINPLPSLVQLKLKFDKLKALSGIKFKGNSRIYVDNVLKREEFGEILFTDYGISGPPILQLSRLASHGLNKNKLVELEVDFFPEYEREMFNKFLLDRFIKFGNRSINECLIGVINKKLIPIILKECGVQNIHINANQLNESDKLFLCTILKNWKFVVCDTNSFSNSQVTSGGIDTREINSKTMESKLIKGLYFAGEIMNVDGDCGGLNLHFAFATGHIAAKNIDTPIN